MNLNELSREQSFALLLVALVVAIAGGYVYCSVQKPPKALTLLHKDGEKTEGQTFSDEKKGKTSSDERRVIVYVCGEVSNPGVYSLPAGSRIHNAIEAAGGARRSGDFESLNLAQVLKNEEKICVPGIEEIEKPLDQQEGKGCERTAPDKSNLPLMVNINSAGADQLDRLPGIGPSSSRRIIEYRARSGAFQRKEDIRNVPGIRGKTFEKIERFITI